MSLFDALLLGLIQGLTEFLPISSDGHLAVAELLLGRERLQEAGGGLLFTLLIHLATMGACLAWFRRELWALTAAAGRGRQAAVARRALLLLATASVPTAIVGFALKDFVDEVANASPVLIGLGFLGTAAALVSTRFVTARAQEPAPPGPETWLADLAAVRPLDAALMGLAQGLAVLPGLSRSGTTIATGLWRGLPPTTAARFSLLMSLPAIGGAFLLELLDAPPGQVQPLPWIGGFVTALVVGWFAIGWLVAIARSRKLEWFGVYAAALGLVLVAFGLLT